MTESYIELHANSAFSFLEGGSQPEGLAERAFALGMPAIAMMDRNGFYGSARFHKIASENGIKAHVGAEVSVTGLGNRITPPVWLPHQHLAEPTRLPLLCETREGYQNLCQLITRFKMRETTKQEGAAKLGDLEEYSRGLVCLTGGEEGPLAAALMSGGEIAGRTSVERLVRIFGQNNVYVEVQRHRERTQEWRNQAALRIAESLHLPVLATNGVRYATRYDREIADLFTVIRNHTRLDRAGRLLALNNQRHLRSADKMVPLFRDILGAVENTVELSSRLGFQLSDLGYEFPRYPVPDGETMDSFLAKRVAEGVTRRYGPKRDAGLLERAKKQVAHELKLIEKLGFAGYFLIVWDIVEYCKKYGILIQGRGSAANSAVCYALEITAIDPVGMELLFERFLSESRGEWPDIDLDLPSEEKREQAIQYVYERYGQLGAAMTANVITYRGKSAARDVGKALGFDPESLQRLSGLVANYEWKGPNDTMARSFQNAGFDVQHPRIAKYLELCMRIQDFPRHLGQHSGGMVICQGQLDKVVPLERASMPGRTVVQWDKEDCANLGIIKVDLLGLGMMAVLKDCLTLVPEHYGETLDLAQLPEDEGVYRTLQLADTIGMFQVESQAQKSSLPKNRPEKFYDLVVQVAIIRPGPIVGKMMHPYMRRRQKKEEVTYPHPSLESTLKRTLGVPLFQEQLLRMAMVVANFSGSEAEELRRAVGMRRSWERMKNLEGRLRAGMTSNGLDAATQETIIQNISSFALYGFPESHAASFALIAYASAYIKVKYLAAFTCAILNNQPMGFYSPSVLIEDARRHGLRVKPIDIQVSDWPCTVEHEDDQSLSLRLGLGYVRGLRGQCAEAIVRSRVLNRYASVDDLVLRVPQLNRKELALLANIGALNTLDGVQHRRDALWQVERAGKPEGPLLMQQSQWLSEEPGESPLAAMTPEERLVADYAVSSVTTGPHPMWFRRQELHRKGYLRAADLANCADGAWVKTAGLAFVKQRPGTASGVVFIGVADETGEFRIFVAPDFFEQNRRVIQQAKFIGVEGPIQKEGPIIHVMARSIYELSVESPAGCLKVESHDFH
ncbi:DNA polymerase III subunit alpha [Granulicella mallensis]|uniref:DNA-directed DNA polymerase n=1 Tax=Granulicella mallensis TaxID=940614 RepID=A0A7W7ZRR2_9BACT|nr:error-prone DNA polymerase [Granulicella mallensis]MBB5064920.1 error-prone DNA polymerase [Granulicella mallensis]